MKKILLLFLTTFVISCSNPYNIKIEKTPKSESEISIVTNTKKFQYEGHVYIVFDFESKHLYSTRSGVIHDPNCPCYNNK